MIEFYKLGLCKFWYIGAVEKYGQYKLWHYFNQPLCFKLYNLSLPEIWSQLPWLPSVNSEHNLVYDTILTLEFIEHNFDNSSTKKWEEVQNHFIFNQINAPKFRCVLEHNIAIDIGINIYITLISFFLLSWIVIYHVAILWSVGDHYRISKQTHLFRKELFSVTSSFINGQGTRKEFRDIYQIQIDEKF